MTKEKNRITCGSNMVPGMGVIVSGDIKPNMQLSMFCSICDGTGKLKAMQMAMTFDAGPVRVEDADNKCPYCKGAGRIYL